jgi:hypothetical protein
MIIPNAMFFIAKILFGGRLIDPVMAGLME